ncbi:sporulation related protein [Crenobacter luteus]|uniref:SPOR domain-containing protein n=1 Tax=Crenobacter luteus TaxID=1452487 RepID=UPI00104E0420|nr:SPOR domain-containing protein [Crenobacter luteus]TCP13690.1 sporulation related protein [Crenobacter luteus]
MKWFFGLVVLLNLLVALWGTLSARAPGDLHALEVNPQGIKLLPGGWRSEEATPAEASRPLAEAQPAVASELPATLDAPAVASATVAKPVKPAAPADKRAEAARADQGAAVCRQWGELTDAQLARVRAGLAPLGLAAAETAREGAPASGKFWVYLPRRATPEATRALSAELKLKGFDNYPVASDPERHGALSLGLFAKEEGANALLAKLKAAGVADARVERRGKPERATTLRFAALSPDADARLAALQARLLPGVPLKTCR